ncbi:MAG: dipeptide epimerase [Bacteroidia bacterium]|jgi:L-alanine-DL-glutamate epimerase-like enolase superfamily enzyme
MEISKIELFKSPIKLQKPFIISLGQFTHAENMLVRIHTDTGLAGWGECSPFMSIHGESMDTCFVVGQYIARNLLHKDPLQIETCSEIMDKLIYGNSSVKSAFDMALYDLAAQDAGVPLYQFLNGKNNKVLQTDYTISVGSAEQMAEDAREILSRGFQIIKVKLGDDGVKDVERIRKVRETIGMEVPLRIDANQGWAVDEARIALKALSPFKIEHCEEPIPKWNFMRLPEISLNSPIPIMADESCCDHHDAERLIALNACTMFNVKLGKSSGIFKALKIIQLAEKADIKMQMGGFLESRLGFTAAAHLALTSEKIVYFDFDTPLMFDEDPVAGGIAYHKNGIISIPDTPGLGATIHEYYLNSLTHVAIT